MARLANGTKVNVCETTTAPVVVRGRSPTSFRSRTRIPLLDLSTLGLYTNLNMSAYPDLYPNWEGQHASHTSNISSTSQEDDEHMSPFPMIHSKMTSANGTNSLRYW